MNLVRTVSLLISLIVMLVPAQSRAATTQETVQTTWRLLDYVAVDYPAAVAKGRVVSKPEYAEMREFTATVEKQLHTLPKSSAQPALLAGARQLRATVEARGDAAAVASQARRLGAALLKAHPVPLAPKMVPDLARGQALYRSTCAACHGEQGRGDGPLARALNPAPVNFTDRNRASERSLFALEQVIDRGLEGTAMQSFASLPPQDRWALAFVAGGFAYPPDRTAEGKRIWEQDAEVRAKIPDLAALSAITPKGLAEQIGDRRASAVIAYLRTNPSAVQGRASAGTTLALTRQKLGQSLTAYTKGNRDEARRLALSAYLDGFEPVEPILSGRNAGLMQRIEAAMGQFRSLIANRAPTEEVAAQARKLDSLFTEAEAVLAPQASSSASTFLSALTILLREGVEALLIVIAMIAFLRKADRTEALRFVHGGWVAALAAGVGTWFIATTLISVSGAGRELTEGFGGIFAAAVLVFVGIWMHGKANAQAWQRYVREKMDRALSRGSGWFLFGLAFLVVYREVFETILFFAAMWTDSPAALTAGILVGACLLGLIAWVMLRYSAKLPISEFFRFSSVLMAVLAVVLAGKGVAAIQEAGLIGISHLSFVPTVDILGLHPSVQVVGAQLLAITLLAVGFMLTGRRPATAAPKSSDYS